ncbi:hypothetical protein ACFVZZ_11735 [Streptomyces chartreusis]|uniref:hypothetical protein n=1 Tax=Streptomyces chartreusis TaxID=1969 RepID=UPI0036DDABEC
MEHGTTNQLGAGQPGASPSPSGLNKWTAAVVACVLVLGVLVFLILVLTKSAGPDESSWMAIKLVGELTAVGVLSAIAMGMQRKPERWHRMRERIKRIL